MEVMRSLRLLDATSTQRLQDVPLGLLRSNATQRHGAARWRREPEGLQLLTVDLHPRLLDDVWSAYAAFVLYHEFLPRWGGVLTTATSEHWNRHGPTPKLVA